MPRGRLYFNEFSKSLFVPDDEAAYPRRQNFVLSGVFGVDTGQNIELELPASNGLIGLQVTELAATPGNGDGEVRAVNGYAAPGDGGDGLFSWWAGVSSGADGFMKINATGGQWRRLFAGQPINPVWFGAVSGTDSTAAFVAARNFAIANNGGAMIVPKGEFIVDSNSAAPTTTFVVGSNFHLRGVSMDYSRIKAKYKYSGGNTASGSAAKGVLEVYSAGFMSNIRIENLTLYGGFDEWDADTVVADNHMRHGLYMHSQEESNEVRVSDVRVTYATGHGFYADTTIFESSLSRCQSDYTGGDSIYIHGNNTIELDRCKMSAPASGRAGIRFNGGFPLIKGCNGLFVIGIDPTVHRISWGVFGDGTNTCRPNIINCNIEAYTRYGCYFLAGSFGTFEGCSWIPNAGCVTRMIHFENIANPGVFGPTNRGYAAPQGDPETQIEDGVPIYSIGVPFISMNPGFTQYTTVGGGVQALPTVVGVGAGFGNVAAKHSNVMVGREYHKTTTVAANYTVQADDNYIDVDTTAGAVTVNLPSLDADGVRVLRITRVAGSNNVIVDAFGGHTVNGSLTQTISASNVEHKLRGKVGGLSNWSMT